MFFVWYDDNPNKPFAQKLNEAATRYQQKFGYAPTHCLLNEKNGELNNVAGVTVETAKTVPLNYLWLQVLETEK